VLHRSKSVVGRLGLAFGALWPLMLCAGAAHAACVDCDGDGLNDGWEVHYFGSVEACAPHDDPDGDGLTNIVEQARGSSPIVAELSRPASGKSPQLRKAEAGIVAIQSAGGAASGPSLGREREPSPPLPQPLAQRAHRAAATVGPYPKTAFWIQLGADTL